MDIDAYGISFKKVLYVEVQMSQAENLGSSSSRPCNAIHMDLKIGYSLFLPILYTSAVSG